MTRETLTWMAERREDGTIVLASPEVGGLTATLPKGRALSPGTVAGSLHVLGRSYDLVVPDGVFGVVTSDAGADVVRPVGYGDEIYTLDPEGVAAGDGGALGGPGDAAAADGALVVKATQPGRVWRSPSPGEPPLCSAGDVVEDGSALCLIEVMKTFSNVAYRAEGGLPGRARIVRWLVDDGGDVDAGQALLEVEAG